MDPSPGRALRMAFGVGAILLTTIGAGCPDGDGPEAGGDPEPAAAPASPSPTPGTTFEATVRPILAMKCAPCHNPGGKMYARLPFDQPGVVSAYAAGVSRRLKGDDLAALEKWLATLPPAGQPPEAKR